MTDPKDTEHVRPPLTEKCDMPADVDPDGVRLLAVLDGVTLTLQTLYERKSENELPPSLTQYHVDRLETAFDTGKRVMDTVGGDTVLNKGLTALPDSLRDDVARDLVPLAPTYGVTLDVEPAGSSIDICDSLTVDVSRWWS